MALTAIKKYLDRFHVAPNLIDNDSTCATFSWEAAERELERSPEYRGLNIAYHCVDRHANSPRRDHLALRWLSKSGEAREVTYDGLRRLTNRFANVLRELGVGQGARVFALTGRIPELYTAALGTLKKWQRVLPAIFRVRARTDSSTFVHWRRECAPHHRSALFQA